MTFSEASTAVLFIAKLVDVIMESPAIELHYKSVFRGITVSLLRPVIGSNVEIDVVALNWVADIRKQIAAAFK